ncbi:MAG: hypothetical protein LJE61_01170 [Thiocapsa sp.]|jgi:hypothetical protein|nr:hypothetical protein [Thiocapsa sp.]MCG6898346.1 hypothetical protein [Thiocapsa sp.]MCG6983800.1 hypothetical protein [Thiocapsa sp.]
MPTFIPNALAALSLIAAMTMSSHAGDLRVSIDETTPVIPTDVTYQRSADGLEVKGWVKKREPHRGRILGHVEIRLLDDQGAVLVEREAYLLNYSPTRRDPEKAGFRTVVHFVPSGTVAIEVAHRVGKRAVGR